MLKGKTAVITGGSRGIGEAIVYRFASEGADIALIYSGNTEKAEEVCRKCESSYGIKAKSYRCDVSDYEQVRSASSEIKRDFQNIRILVNNAGITRDGLIAMMKEESFDEVINTNLKGAFNMIRHFSSLFIKNHEGSIINISSVTGIMGNAGQANYAASKAGLIGLTKSVARELAPKGITCNAIAPGFIKTDMTENQTENPMLNMIPLKRMGKPEDVAQACVYLATADYVTGEVIRVDGGIAM